MNKKIPIVIVVVVIIVAAAVLVPYVMSDDDETTEKVYVEYDSSLGWASWNPTVSIIDSSKLAGSPYLAITIRDQVEDFYGVEVEDVYDISDVPDDFMTYDSLVSYDDDGQLVISSTAKNSEGDYESIDLVIEETPDYYMCTGSMIVTIYYVLCEVYGTEFLDYDSDVLEELWDMIYATDAAGYSRLEGNYGISTDLFDGVKLSSVSSTADYQEEYISILDSVSSEGKTICFLATGYWSDKTWITEACEEVGSEAVMFRIDSLSNVLAEIEAIAYIMGYGDLAQNIIDNMRVDLYNTYMCGQEQASLLPYEYCAVCTYISNDYTFGYNSMAQEIFDFMGLRNIKTDESGYWSEEYVIAEQPEYLLMVGSGDIDWDALYRVTS